jgi:hypothetical protein
MHDQRIFEIAISKEGDCFLKKRSIDSTIKRGWRKVISADMPLPLPSAVEYFYHVPGKQLTEDEHQLKAGEIVIEAYELKSFKGKNGVMVKPWVYRIFGIDKSGTAFCFDKNWSDIKKQMRQQGLDQRLLEGTRTLAALVRIAHATRQGIIFRKPSHMN